MKTTPVLLYGSLRAKFGKRFDLAVASPAEAVRALCRMMPGFRAHLEQHSEPGYRVRVGKEFRGADGLMLPSGDEAIRIIPVVAGAKDDILQIVVGVVLVAAGLYFGQAWLVNIGASMVIGGVAQMIAGSPSFAQSALDQGPADTPSYVFSGPHMTTGQGNPVPLGYGKLRVSGALVSLAVSAETWPVKGFGGMASDEVGTQTGNGDTTPWVWAVAPSV